MALCTNLPGRETRGTQEMSAWLYPYVLVVLGTYLAQLEGGAHLAVQFVLFLSHFDVVLRRVVHEETQVRVDIAPVRVQIATTTAGLGLTLRPSGYR